MKKKIIKGKRIKTVVTECKKRKTWIRPSRHPQQYAQFGTDISETGEVG